MKYNLYIHLKGYNENELKKLCTKIEILALKFNFKPCGLISLPTSKKLFTVLKSPHVHKKSRDQFTFKINKKLLIFSFSLNESFFLKLFINELYIVSESINVKLIYKKLNNI